MRLWRRKKRAAKPRREKRIISAFLPPEGVPLRFEVASLGARIGAQIIDIVLTVALVLVFVLLLGATGIVSWSAVTIIASLLFFGIRVPYYALTELLWNGQTMGKRFTHLRVISADGRSLSAHAVAVRNLMKEMEVFVPGVYLLAAPVLSWQMRIALFFWITILVAVPLMNRRRQRLGDIIANTYVVYMPKPALLPDIATLDRSDEISSHFTFLPNQLDHYGRFELQTLEVLLQTRTDILKRKPHAAHLNSLKKVSAAIRNRISYTDPIPQGETLAFLQSFYRTQRAYLENRKLFGDARENKFHKAEAETT